MDEVSEEKGGKVAQDKADEDDHDTAEEEVVGVVVGPTDSAVEEKEDGRESEKVGIGIGRKTTSLLVVEEGEADCGEDNVNPLPSAATLEVGGGLIQWKFNICFLMVKLH
ncbi:hypothetical protein SOVF_055840 [Spinacia oleracea]|uniref:Uncharacterized protein n=1 Tax=Spinacia oleracea TaxID=3562 RepID=A0ABM3RTI6_SPIOL|nr:uncharacterized protein LOC130472322 [Spinacia oleracea]KNA20001.1 hypothetical protein SOVF_055840 [Spinacia oleracea]